MFKKIDRPIQIYKEVALQIEEAILLKKLNIGDRLPSERDLAKNFDVSRRTLRESLRVVEQKGLVEIRPAGAFIVMETKEKFSQSLALAIKTQKLSWNDIAQFRGEIEENIILRALQNATNEDIQSLKKITVKMQAMVDQKKIFEWEKYLNLDKQFHLCLADIAGNPIYNLILRTFLDNLGIYYEAYRDKEHEFSFDNLNNLKSIVSAIQKKDEKAAQKLIRKHFELGTAYMEKITER